MTRPTRYKENESNRDWIDEFCATKSVDEVRGAFLFNLGKYQRRYGKKDEHLQEALKIQDYANRLVEYESSISKPIIRELYTEATESRMDVVGQNGNTAEHYDQSPDWSKAPEGATHWGPETDGFYGAWYKKECDEWFCQPVPNGMGWFQADYRSDLVPRPEQEWIPSYGKRPGLPDDTRVDVKFSDGYVEGGRGVDLWAWSHDGTSDDITHYRIHQPE